MRPTLILATLLAVASPGLPLQAQEATAAENAPAASAPALPAITVTTVDLIQLSDRVIASGLVAAVEEVQVAPLVEGQPLDQLLADVGDMVVEGQVLAVLSKTTLELQKTEAAASLAAAKSAVAQAEAQVVEAKTARDEAQRVADRTATLRAQGTAPQAQADTATANALSANARVAVATQGLESARAQLALAQARLENVDLMLSRTEVKAPVAGRIVERNAKIGAIATAAGQPMFVITRDGALELRADVSEADILRGLYDEVRAQQSALEAWSAVLQLFVQAPALLYRVERGAGEAMPGLLRLTDHEMASRLSYFFLDSMPDEELFQEAAAGRQRARWRWSRRHRASMHDSAPRAGRRRRQRRLLTIPAWNWRRATPGSIGAARRPAIRECCRC